MTLFSSPTWKLKHLYLPTYLQLQFFTGIPTFVFDVIELLSLQEGNIFDILCFVIETQYMASFGKVLSMLKFIYSEKAT